MACQVLIFSKHQAFASGHEIGISSFLSHEVRANSKIVQLIVGSGFLSSSSSFQSVSTLSLFQPACFFISLFSFNTGALLECDPIRIQACVCTDRPGKQSSSVWKACGKLSKIWKSSLSKRLKYRVFAATVESVLLYGCEAWTLTPKLAKNLDGCYTRMLRSAYNIHWSQHVTKC